jgi:uncharacterized protein YjbI with pentapeptide repeats
MANPEHVAKLTEGVEAWNKWRAANPKVVPDLSNAIIGEDFTGPHLPSVNLSSANLAGAWLSRIQFYGADFASADLTGARLGACNLRAANLTMSDLTEANLSAANLTIATLAGANFDRAICGNTIFGDNDLSEVKGLESVEHLGSSVIGIETIYRSQGKIPVPFLRGAGVPDNFIDYMGSLIGKALEFYSCFISYSTRDQEFADRLYADLQNKGVRCWFSPHDIKGGRKMHEQIDEAIRMHERLLLILSTDSMKSPWVRTEIRKARKREIGEKRRVLFPVSLVPFTDICTWECFYADEGIDLAEEIREYYVPDFTSWTKDHDSYLSEFQKLLNGLKAA